MPNNPIILPKGIASADGDAVAASQTHVVNTALAGIFSNVDEVQTALERVDGTGLGAQFRQITGSFAATYFAGSDNTNTWYGGNQTVGIRVVAPTNGQYTFTMPDSGDMASVFSDLASRGLGQVYTLTLEYNGGNSGFVNRNRLTINNASISNGFPQGTFPTVLAQGQSATFRIERVGGVTGQWERLGIQNTANPVPTFGEFVFQNIQWNNSDNSSLPGTGAVLKGYAFPVGGSNPNDGTLRQGLLDSGVSDRIIYDGDYVVWTADSFTSWLDGDDWFVLPRNQLELLSREQGNFLAQVSEIDNRADVAPVSFLANDALVWLSENPLAEAPFLNPSTDSNNPRSGDDYRYIGGRENRDGMMRFQFSQNRFNSYLTLGITPSFIAAHDESDIFIYLRDIDGNITQTLNLASDFTFVDDATFTNGTVRHYQRSTSFNYPFLATIEIWLTQVQEHFRLNPASVDITQNVANLMENQLSPDVAEKLNRALPDPGTDFSSIEDRLMRRGQITISSPDHAARFYSASASDPYPQGLADFTQVSADSPIFTATDVVLFVATPEPGLFVLMNTTADTIFPLMTGTPDVEVVESLTDSGTTYFIWRISGVTSGHRFEVNRTTIEDVIVERNDIANLKDDIIRIDAELSHAALNLPDEVVDILDNELSVTEESTPTTVSTAYNNGLGSTTSQSVFFEVSPNTPSAGILTSNAISATSGSRARRKLMYIPEDQVLGNSVYLSAFDGTTGRDLIEYSNGVFNAKVRIPSVPASTSTQTIYPAPATRVSGAGIWQNIPALTFVNGVPVPEADELFFTRNIPTSSTTLTIQYRGHANGNIFGAGTTTLDNVGGSSDQFANFTINDGSETAFIEVRYSASDRNIRVSVTERVNSGLPTINDIEVILSYSETRTIPATPGSTRDVRISSDNNQTHTFAIKPSASNTLIIVGDEAEVDTRRDYTTLFGNDENGHLVLVTDNGTFFDYEDMEPTSATVSDLENHGTLPQYGLFTTQYSRETELNIGVTVRPAGLNVADLPTSATGLASGDIWVNGGVLSIVP